MELYRSLAIFTNKVYCDCDDDVQYGECAFICTMCFLIGGTAFESLLAQLRLSKVV